MRLSKNFHIKIWQNSSILVRDIKFWAYTRAINTQLIFGSLLRRDHATYTESPISALHFFNSMNAAKTNKLPNAYGAMNRWRNNGSFSGNPNKRMSKNGPEQGEQVLNISQSTAASLRSDFFWRNMITTFFIIEKLSPPRITGPKWGITNAQNIYNNQIREHLQRILEVTTSFWGIHHRIRSNLFFVINLIIWFCEVFRHWKYWNDDASYTAMGYLASSQGLRRLLWTFASGSCKVLLQNFLW